MAQRTCEIDGCEKKHYALGLCRAHYVSRRRTLHVRECTIDSCHRPLQAHGRCGMHLYRWRRYGSDELLSTQQRFWQKVDKTSSPQGCWLWTGALNHGYGDIHINGRTRRAHRVAYEWLVGPIPLGLHIDHLCRVRACVNPSHLEPVTQQENINRGLGASVTNKAKTHCVHGHEFTHANTYLNPKDGARMCRACLARRQRELQLRRPIDRRAHQAWRLRVLERDGYRCTECGTTDRLRVHHRVPIAVDAALAAVDANGVTLCHDCHWEEHRRMSRSS